MLEALDKQIIEKNKLREAELKNNQKYINMVISQDENDKKRQKEEEAKAAKRRKDVQIIQKMQMASPEKVTSDGASSKRQMGKVGSHMSLEELRMNKGILKEISKKKKSDLSSIN